MTNRTELAVLGGSPAVPACPEPRAPWPRITKEDADYVASVLQHTQPIIGSDSQEIVHLENEWCHTINVPYCRAVGSGTAALHMALWAAGVGPGDEVLVPAYSFNASAMAVLHAGAIPVFVDILRDSYNMNPDLIESHTTDRTKAILVVHLNGLPAEMNRITEIAGRRDLALIEDCAHAHGAAYHGQKVGTFGDAASFSLNGAKNLPAGEGGLFATQHESYYERSRALWMGVTLAAQRESEKYPLFTLGYNYRCSLMTAALARRQLLRMDELNALRQANCERLSEQLHEIPGVIPPVVPEDRTHVYHMYRVRFDPNDAGRSVPPDEFRAKVVAALGAEGVLCRSWMNWTLPELAVFSRPEEFEKEYPWRRTWHPDRQYSADDCPEARRLVRETAVVADAPTAAGPEVIDALAAGFRKVLSRIDDVMRLDISEDLTSGELASCDAIRQELSLGIQ